LLADDNENHMLMLTNCWILDHVYKKLQTYLKKISLI